MGEKLTQLMYTRAASSKDPEEYVELVKKLHHLLGLSDDEFIKEMGW